MLIWKNHGQERRVDRRSHRKHFPCSTFLHGRKRCGDFLPRFLLYPQQGFGITPAGRLYHGTARGIYQTGLLERQDGFEPGRSCCRPHFFNNAGQPSHGHEADAWRLQQENRGTSRQTLAHHFYAGVGTGFFRPRRT